MSVPAPLPWHGQQWQRVLAAVGAGRLPHASLVAGAADGGSQRFVEALAALLLCRAPAATACGQCKACRLTAAGHHGDRLALGPAGKAETIQVAQVREAIAFATQTPSLGERKVLVISPAERLNAHAANALLKLLEEPAPDTFLLLLTARESRLPATVRSRCQCIRLPLPARSQAAGWLREQGVSADDAERALTLTRGRPLAAAALAQGGGLAVEAKRRALLAALLRGEASSETFAAAVADLTPLAFCELLLAGLEDLLRELDAATLRRSRNRRLLAFVGDLQRAIAALGTGANPQPELLRQALLARLEGILGGPGPGATLTPAFSLAASA